MATTLPPTQTPGKEDYAGDEINALILDPGSYVARAGFAGEDTPKSVIPTHYLHTDTGERLFGENSIHLPRGDADIKNPYNTDGLVEDWETATKLWEYTVTSRLTGPRQTPPSRNGLNDKADGNGDVDMDAGEAIEEQEKPLAEYPLLVTEPNWNPREARAKMIEVAMEDWGVPAYFMAKSGMLAACAAGKPSALVIDVGHYNTSVSAVWEGTILRKSIFRTPLAGNFASEQIRLMFAQHDPIVPMTAHYMIKTKTPVDANSGSNATFMKYDKPPRESFRKNEEERVVMEFKESVVQVWQGPGSLSSPANPQGPASYTNLDHVKNLPPRPFEMPDGWNTVFGPERFKVVESLFDHNAAYKGSSSTAPTAEQTISAVAREALQACDVDTRPVLLNNVLLTGGGSLIEKLAERLQSDLQASYPNPKVRVIVAPNSVERKFGAWIGGSVLASLGTFHQLWISKAEYDEFGSGIVEKRCK